MPVHRSKPPTPSRRARAAPLAALALDRDGPRALQRQLVDGLKQSIARGAWVPGSRMPSSRALAEDLRISRNTVIAAYDRLVDEGYLEAVPRFGMQVNVSLPAALGAPATSSPRLVRSREVAPSAALTGPRPFRPNQPDVRLFPLAVWNRLRARRLRGAGAGVLHYQSNQSLGLPELRRVLADYLRESRGVRCDWRQIAITTGSQLALFLLAQTLLEPGSHVLMEDPGYPGARLTWEQRGARVEDALVDDQGAQVPTTESRAATALVYLTPSRQHPTGVPLSMPRRLAWLDFAARQNARIVEDDYDSELRYGLSPLPSLHSLDTSGRVIFVGSMSKVLFPSLRIGYVVLPDALVDRVADVRTVVDDHGPLIDQMTLATFIDSGAFHKHVRRCRRAYHERQGVLIDTARRVGLPLALTPADGGMNILGRLAEGVDDDFVSSALARHGFDIPPLSRYANRRMPPALLLGYTAFTVAELERHIKRLATVMPKR